jgi:hypothetical protein
MQDEIPDFDGEKRFLYAQSLLDVVEFIYELNHNRADTTEALTDRAPTGFKAQAEQLV